MKPLPQTFLSLAVICLLVGLTNLGGSFAFGILRPASAICMILFFITHLLAGVMDEFDSEEAARLSHADRVNGHGAAPARKSVAAAAASTLRVTSAQAH